MYQVKYFAKINDVLEITVKDTCREMRMPSKNGLFILSLQSMSMGPRSLNAPVCEVKLEFSNGALSRLTQLEHSWFKIVIHSTNRKVVMANGQTNHICSELLLKLNRAVYWKELLAK